MAAVLTGDTRTMRTFPAPDTVTSLTGTILVPGGRLCKLEGDNVTLLTAFSLDFTEVLESADEVREKLESTRLVNKVVFTGIKSRRSSLTGVLLSLSVELLLLLIT